MKDKRMKIFISWSQQDSKEIAKTLKTELSKFFNRKIEFWVSAMDINSGGVSANEIITALQDSDMIIVCLDSSNYNKPWIYFETGMVFGRKYDNKLTGEATIVYPIIFDELNVSDFSNTPFSALQLMKFSKQSFHNMLLGINKYYKKLTAIELLAEDTLNDFFEPLWNKIHNSVNSIIVQRNHGVDSVLNSDNVVEKIKQYNGFPEAKKGKTIQYDFGFETETFYRFLLENVKTRLYIFGRKNRKIIGNDLKNEFGKILKDNVDLRMLYIHPDAEDSKNNTAQDIKEFRKKLIISLNYAEERFDELKVKIEDHCRLYKCKRDSEIIIADDVVFFKDLGYSQDGKPLHFTNDSFFIVSVDSKIGSDYFNKFMSTWEKAEIATKEIMKSME